MPSNKCIRKIACSEKMEQDGSHEGHETEAWTFDIRTAGICVERQQPSITESLDQGSTGPLVNAEKKLA